MCADKTEIEDVRTWAREADWPSRPAGPMGWARRDMMGDEGPMPGLPRPGLSRSEITCIGEADAVSRDAWGMVCI